MSLKGKTVFITGASRGIGKAVAIRVAREGANVVIAAKTTEPHPKLPGTIFTAAKEVESVGGKALPVVCDIREEEQVKSAIEKTIEHFGAIDVLVNNASAISLTDTENTSMKKFDLMHQVNARGTFMVSKYCIPYLKRSKNPHILNISPPLTMTKKWFAPSVAYTMAKYGMSMCVLGMAGELRKYRIAVNALWPLTAIDTAALQMIAFLADKPGLRKPEIMADAALVILNKDSGSFSGNFCIDEFLLRDNGVEDFDKYALDPNCKELELDAFLSEEDIKKYHLLNKKSKL